MMAAALKRDNLIDRLPLVRGTYEEDVALANLTWFRVGGPAEVLFRPADEDDLGAFLAGRPTDVPYTVIGVGSNLLVRDGGVPGVVIRLSRAFARVSVKGTKVTAGASAPDVNVALDAHVVWRVPLGFLTFLGAGASVHFLNGDGAAIADTFIEDLLDSISAGLALQTGLEYPMSRHIRLYGTGRLELLEDIRYSALRGGVQIQLGSPTAGEESP